MGIDSLPYILISYSLYSTARDINKYVQRIVNIVHVAQVIQVETLSNKERWLHRFPSIGKEGIVSCLAMHVQQLLHYYLCMQSRAIWPAC